MSIAAIPVIPLGIRTLLYLVVVGSVIRIPRDRRPSVGHKRHRKRFTRQQRAKSIYRRIYESTVRNKPLTVRQIARAERISKNTVYRYLRIIRRSQRKRGILINIRRVKNKRFLIYENIAVKEQQILRRQPAPTVPRWELRGSVKYTQGHDLVLEIMILIANRDHATIDRGIEQIKEILRDHNFGGLADSIGDIDFGTIPATAQSKRYFWYRHSGDDNATVVW